jgi:oligopeptide transport system substrate-binding protein
MKRFATMKLLLTGLMLGALLGCEQPQTGAVRVTVLGEDPRLVDPALGELDTAEKVLLANTAQGLVRFDAQGNIEAGLAERWNVSDDGLSYIFRLQTGEWPSGRKIRAQDVARMIRQQIAPASRNSLKDTVGAVSQVVAMTDRVLAIELGGPRPHLLQLLAQPEFSLVRSGAGTGPFTLTRPVEGGATMLVRPLPAADGEDAGEERVILGTASTEAAVQAFKAGNTDLVLGGDFADLGIAIGARLPRGTLRFDPVAGLFGLVPARRGGVLADQELRALLDRAIDRNALVGALGVPDLEARASILQPQLDGGIVPAVPAWTGVPLAERRQALVTEAQRLLPREEGEPAPVIRVAVPDGPGGTILLERLRADWSPLGLSVEAAERGQPADLRVVDAVAPSIAPAWFLRSFRCGAVPICSEEADALLDAARLARDARQRSALFAEAERLMREQTLFIPLAAPVRWSLVANGLPGFVENRFARHPLWNLREPPAGGS